MSEQKENTSISYQKDFAQRHVQTNNVGYIYLFLDLLIFFAQIQTGNWITNISEFKA